MYTMSSILNVRLLVTKLHRIADWFMLGVHLGVPKEELNKIDQQFLSHGVERCKAELFDLWLRRNPSVRWDDVASALEQLNEVALASELRELYQMSDPAPSMTPPPAHDDGQKQEPESIVRVKVSKSTVRQFALLEGKFSSLVCKIKAMTVKKGVIPGELHSFLEVRLNQDIEFFPSTTISDLFKYITPYYCFLNTTLLENIINEFLGEPLQQQLDEYESLLEEFTSSTKISLLKEIDLPTIAQRKGMPLVILKLAGRCLDVTIKRFQELVKCIFGKKSSVLYNIQVEDGCICITWNTRESAVPSLIALAREYSKIQFMKHVGILRLTVGAVTIFEQPGTVGKWGNSSLEDHLVQSVSSCCTEAVEFLLKAGADPSHHDTNGTSVLGIASMIGTTTIAKMLIDAGAGVNLGGNETTSLILACEESREDIVNLLLQSGADPNLQTDTGQTALLSVDYSNCHSLGIVRSLLEAGAVVNTQDSNGWSGLAIACKYGCYRIAELLIRYGADVQLSVFDKSTPLMIACHYRHEDIAALLLNSQADPNLLNGRKNTALMMACHQQLAQTVSLLLSSGVDPNLQSDKGWTALMLSCTFKDLEYDNCIPALLISKKADPSLQTEDGFTALMLSARYSYVSGAKILLDAQVHVNAQDRLGHTALHHAALFGNLTTAELLLSAGADLSLVDSGGKTAVDVALDYQHDEVCQLLLSYTGTKLSETGSVEPSQINPLQDTSSLSSKNIAPYQELEQLRIALRHPLPPPGTTKHDADQLEDIDEYAVSP